jgi:hypothetical protein
MESVMPEAEWEDYETFVEDEPDEWWSEAEAREDVEACFRD